MPDTVVPCDRCARPCRPGAPVHKDAKLMRRAKRGLCPDCAITQWLRLTPGISDTLARVIEEHGPQALLAPHLRAVFSRLLPAGNADATPDEINWERVVANWHLPVPGEENPHA